MLSTDHDGSEEDSISSLELSEESSNSTFSSTTSSLPLNGYFFCWDDSDTFDKLDEDQVVIPGQDIEQDDTMIIQDEDPQLLSSLPFYICSNMAPPGATKQCEIELLSIIKKLGAPLNGYDLIMQWANKYATEGIDFVTQIPRRRKMVMQDLLECMDLTRCIPKITTIKLQYTERKVDIITFDLKAMVQSLLDDESIYKAENFLPNFDVMEGPENYDHVGDVHTGSAWRSAHERMCTEPEDILCPLILFIDRTPTNLHGQLSLEPVSFTLGWFNAETRRKADAWRMLGYIPNFNLKSKAMTNLCPVGNLQGSTTKHSK